MSARPRSFRTPEDFRAWLERNHSSERELIMRLFKVHARERGIGYKEALDAALCYGWIDGIRRALDADSFTQRFTPRKAKSNWSAVNIKRARELIVEGLMRPPGLAAFERRDTAAPAPYSFENAKADLAPAFRKRFRADQKAWEFFRGQAPWYRRTAAFWVMQAKRAETRERRFAALLAAARKGRRVPPLGGAD